MRRGQGPAGPADPLEAPTLQRLWAAGAVASGGAPSPASLSALRANLLSRSGGRKRWPSNVDEWMGAVNVLGGLAAHVRAAAPLMGPPRPSSRGGAWGAGDHGLQEPPGIPACVTLTVCADASRALPHLIHTACFLVKPRVSFRAAQTTVLTAPIRRVHWSLLAASGRSS